jgi:putative glycosyltransferase (TIGR04372 family)
MSVLVRAKGLVKKLFPRLWSFLRRGRRQMRLARGRSWVYAGQGWLVLGQVARARAAWQRAVKVSRGDPLVFKALLPRCGKHRSSLEWLGPWLESTSCGLEYSEIFDDLRLRDPASSAVRLSLARNAWLRGQVEHLIPDLKPVVLGGTCNPFVWEVLEKAVVATNSKEALLWELLGHRAFQNNNLELARQHYENALVLSPGTSNLTLGLGVTLLLLGCYQEATSRLKVAQPDHSHGDSLFYLGLAYHYAGDSDRACALWLQYLELVGEDTPAIPLLGELTGTTLEKDGQVRPGALPVTSRLLSAIRSAVATFWQNLGHNAFQQNDLELARHRYEKGLSVTPDSQCLKSALGITLLLDERVEEAIPLLEYCSRQEPVSGDTLLYLCMAYAARGETERAQAAWRRQRDLIGEDTDRLHFHFVTLHVCGAFELARSCELRHREIQQRGKLSLPPVRPIFRTWWTRAIGHIAHLDVWLKSRELVTGIGERPTIRTRPDMISNRCYLSCWTRWLEIEEVHNPEINPGEVEIIFPPMISVPGQGVLPCYLAFGAIEQQWERLGRGPLLRLPESARDRGWQQLGRLGVSPGQPFVTLHIRQPGFKKWDVGFRHRNAHLESYLPAIKELVRHGVRVIRLGSPHGQIAPSLDGLIDYAHSDLRNDWMDVFLCAEGLFHIGVESGISHIPMTFGRPTLFTNWMRWGTLPWFGGDMVMPKLFRSEMTGELIPLSDIVGTAQEHPQYSFFLSARGLQPVPNTSEDIRDAALEMLDRTQGKPSAPNLEEELLQSKIRDLLWEHGQVMNCRLARGYLHRYRRVLTERRGLRDSA